MVHIDCDFFQFVDTGRDRFELLILIDFEERLRPADMGFYYFGIFLSKASKVIINVYIR